MSYGFRYFMNNLKSPVITKNYLRENIILKLLKILKITFKDKMFLVFFHKV